MFLLVLEGDMLKKKKTSALSKEEELNFLTDTADSCKKGGWEKELLGKTTEISSQRKEPLLKSGL